MSTAVFTLTIEHTGDTAEIQDLVTEYLEREDCPFRTDYSPPTPDEGDTRDDGYNGPFITGVDCSPTS
jgi:hypothetical protein